MDNRIFDVNGKTKEQLHLAVKLLLLDEYNSILSKKVQGWYLNPKKGLVLTWYVGENQKKATPFTNRMGEPEPIDVDELTNLLWDWLSSEEADSIELDGWDKDLKDSDVSMSPGWRLYAEEWGHVKETEHTIDHYSIAAFRKVNLWYGK